jgi:hypothetical protein
MIQSAGVDATCQRAFALSLTLASFAWSGHAHAHPLVDEGRARYEEADFGAAIETFARAERADDLTLEDLATLYETRALVHLAMGNAEAMRADLTRLAAVAPDHSLDSRAPPEVLRAFVEARASAGPPIRLLASPSSSSLGVTIAVEVQNDGAGLVRAVRIRGRSAGASGWESAEDAPLTVVTGGEAIVEYWAVAIGPGGAPLASVGSEDAPLRYGAAGEDVEGGGASEGGGSALPWILIGAGVILVAVAVAVTIVLVGNQDAEPTTQVSPFVVGF